MKNNKLYFNYLIILALSFVTITCNSVKYKKPQIKVENSNINLGTIDIDSTYDVKFRIFNIGSQQLIIDTVSVSCDCSVPSFNKRKVQPHTSIDLIIKYSPVDEGEFKKVIIIKSNIDSIFTVLKFYVKIKK